MNLSSTKTIFSFVFLFFFFNHSTNFAQQVATLVKDINTPAATQSNAFGNIEEFNGKIIYPTYNDNLGTEPWISDGTIAGTKILKDINPGFFGSNPRNFFLIGNKMIFTANDNQHGGELWITDGTTAGTQLLKDIFPGSGNSNTQEFFTHNGFVYFKAIDQLGSSPTRWRTDGTTAGTLKDPGVVPGQGILGSFYNGTYYFSEPQLDSELATWDGVSPTFQRVKDIFPGSSEGSHPRYFQEFNGKIYFTATDTYNNRELWVTDGTEAGTQLIEDLRTDGNGGNPTFPVIAGNHLYFAAYSNADGLALFRLNGTEDGIDLVKDFAVNTETMTFSGFAEVNGALVFATINSTTGEEALWRSEGEEANTTKILDMNTVSHVGGKLNYLYQKNGIAYYTVRNNLTLSAIYKTDGTAAGTQLYKEGLLGFQPLNQVPIIDGTAYYSASENNTPSTLWKDDGNSVEPVEYIPIPAAAASNPSEMVPFNNYNYFIANTFSNGLELWRTDGSEANTQQVKDIFPGKKSSVPFYQDFKEGSAVFQNQLYFVADDGTNLSIWRTDGNEANTEIYHVLKPTPINPVGIALHVEFEVFDGDLYFKRIEGNNAENGLYKIIDPNQAPVLVSDQVRPFNLFPVGQKMYFLQADTAGGFGYEIDYNIQLYETDGTEAGTQFIQTLAYSDYYNRAEIDLFNVNEKLAISIKEYYEYRFIYDGDLIIENPDAFLASQSPTFYQNAVYFGNNWNPNDAGTTGALYKWENNSLSIVKPFPAFKPGPAEITLLGSKMIFTAHGDDATGNELWISDGTSAGTQLLKDIYPGADSGNPSQLLVHNGKLYFTASDATGKYIFESDGTPGGTKKFGAISGAPDIEYLNLYASGDYLYFNYDNGQIGQEPYKIDLTITPPTDGPDLELSMSISDPFPGIYDNTIITAIVTNTGTESASGIKVEMPTPSGELAFTSATTSQGSYSSYFDEWSIGSLGAGQSAILDLNLFTLTADQIDYFAQVKTMNETDIDSNPNNGTCCTANEDDEAYLSINGTATQQPDLQLANFNSVASGDPGEVTNFTIDLTNSGNVLASGDYEVGIYLSTDNSLSNNDIEVGIINTGNTPIGTITDVPGAISVPVGQAPGNYFLIAKIDHEEIISESNENNNTISTSYQVNSTSNCSISIFTGTPYCDDNDTPMDDSDDNMLFTFESIGINTSNVLDLVINNESFLHTPNQLITIARPIADGAVSISLTDPNNPGCTASTVVETIPTCSNSTAGVDLELFISVNQLFPPIYTNVTITLELFNRGTESSSGAVVDFQIPDNYAFVSQFIFEGTYSNWNGEWQVPAIAPGASATMDVTIFSLSTASTNLYTQVIQQNEDDIDSTPGNGMPPTANEDDEFGEVLNSNSTNCIISNVDIVTTCADQGTTDPSDDRFTFTLDITGTGLGTTYDLSSTNFSWQNVPYSGPGLAGYFQISDGPFDITILDESGSCSKTVTVVPPAPCSTGGSCVINDASLVFFCEYLDPNDPNDDEFNFTTQPSGSNLGASYSIPEIPGATGLSYSTPFSSSNFPVSGGTLSITFVDDDNPNCSWPLMIFPNCPPIGSEEIDLQINLTADDFNPAQYSTFGVIVDVVNNSLNPATGVEVEFPVPDGFVLSGGNEYSATQGSYTTFGGSTWTVGNLPAGETARIIFNLFVLDNSQTPFFTQVSAANEDDVDSTPNNSSGVCCANIEDDEDFINININPTSRLGASEKGQLFIQNLFPNPAIDQIQLRIESPEVKNTSMLIYNSLGQTVRTKEVNLQEGINDFSFDISDLPSGIYFIHLPEGHQLKNQRRFVKERN